MSNVRIADAESLHAAPETDEGASQRADPEVRRLRLGAGAGNERGVTGLPNHCADCGMTLVTGQGDHLRYQQNDAGEFVLRCSGCWNPLAKR